MISEIGGFTQTLDSLGVAEFSAGNVFVQNDLVIGLIVQSNPGSTGPLTMTGPLGWSLIRVVADANGAYYWFGYKFINEGDPTTITGSTNVWRWNANFHMHGYIYGF